MATRARLGQALIIALVLGALYWQQDSDQKGVQNINGALFILLAYISFAYIYFEVTAFLSELRVFRQEHFAGMYRIDAFFLARQLVDLPLSILEPLLVTTIFYWTIGLNPDPRRFVACCGLVLLCVQVVNGKSPAHLPRIEMWKEWPTSQQAGALTSWGGGSARAQLRPAACRLRH